MRIVKKGTKRLRKYQGDCYHCGAMIEATEEELHVEYDHREGGTFAHVSCLQCKSDVVLYPIMK